jgi:hypothetical protein
MRNHEWVPAEVIGRISKLRGGETYKVLIKLLKNKFIVHTGKRCIFILIQMTATNSHIWVTIIWHYKLSSKEAFLKMLLAR